MYVLHGTAARSQVEVYKSMNISKACSILGIRDREYRESDPDSLREAFTRRVSLKPQDPTFSAKLKHFYKNHMHIHEAYQFLLKKRTAQLEQQERERLQAEAEAEAEAKGEPADEANEAIKSEGGNESEKEEDQLQTDGTGSDFIQAMIVHELASKKEQDEDDEDEFARNERILQEKKRKDEETKKRLKQERRKKVNDEIVPLLKVETDKILPPADRNAILKQRSRAEVEKELTSLGEKTKMKAVRARDVTVDNYGQQHHHHRERKKKKSFRMKKQKNV